MREQRHCSAWPDFRASGGARPPNARSRFGAPPDGQINKNRRELLAPFQTHAGERPISAVPRLEVKTERLSARAGATADELVQATGWQRHSRRMLMSGAKTQVSSLIALITTSRECSRKSP
jgi:hypothetical protein